ncbi:MAG: sulfotransferase [Halioglobus sp.]
MQQQSQTFDSPPVAIGGVGGSGTRLIADTMMQLGFQLGTDLNGPRDNLAFSFLFKRAELWPLDDHREELNQALDLFFNAMYFHRPLTMQEREFITKLALIGRPPHAADWPSARAAALLQPSTGQTRPKLWGWKEPNTHIFLPALIERVPGMKYIHVVRHGLDMAHSDNQSQLLLWGQALTNKTLSKPNPGNSFEYWCAAHERILRIGATMESNFYLLNYDKFCSKPERELEKLLQFLQLKPEVQSINKILREIEAPASISRHRKQARLAITDSQRDLLVRLGFNTDWTDTSN